MKKNILAAAIFVLAAAVFAAGMPKPVNGVVRKLQFLNNFC